MKENYWILNAEMHLWKNSVLEEHEREFYLLNTEKLYPYSTQLNTSLLQRDVLLRATKRMLEISTYLGVNYPSFLLVLSFCLSRLLRSFKLCDTWGESNIGLIYSPTKNCGKSMVLYILAQLQGLISRQHPLLVSGGNQGTSGTSAKKILETLSKTTLTTMIDDPLISEDLGEFLNQVQGGLIQGSTSSGTFAPKGSILLTSNNKEVRRIEGRVQRFDFCKDDAFELDEQRETQLMAFVEENKGLLLAWSIRYLPVWNDCVDKYISLIQRAVRLHFPLQQIRWIRGIAFTVLAKTMLLGSAKCRCNVLQTLQDLGKKSEAKPTLPVLSRFQLAVFELIKGHIGKVQTWINPFCSVKLASSESNEKAYAFAVSTINILNEVNNKDIIEVLKDMAVNAVSRPVSFAVNADTPLAKLRKKDGGDDQVMSKRAHKIPLCCLEPQFIAWVDYALGLSRDRPNEDFQIRSVEVNEGGGEQPSDEIVTEISQLEETVFGITSAFSQEQNNEENARSKEASKFAENLSPLSREKWDSFTPKRKQAFEMGFKAATKNTKSCSSTTSVGTSMSPNVFEQLCELTRSQEDEIQFCSDSKVETVRTVTKGQEVAARKELFPEGAVGVLLSEEPDDHCTSTKRSKRRKK